MKKSLRTSNSDFLRPFFKLSGLLLSLLFLVLFIITTDIIFFKGFNGSDDGVILAQAFRILSGEIPHKDFISLRPIFSGIFHSINFFLPFPLFISGRILAITEIWLYSLIISWIISNFFLTSKLSSSILNLIIFISFFITTFLLNLNNFLPYPWTTVDGILFSTIAIYLFLSSSKDNNINTKIIKLTTSLFFSVIASLCKQNFIFITIFFTYLTLKSLLEKTDYFKASLYILIAFSPYVLYCSFLIYNNCFDQFVTQITGQTNFFNTAILTFIKKFIKSKILFLHIFSITILLLISFYKNTKYNKTIQIISSLLSIFYTIILIVYIPTAFFTTPTNFYNSPYEIFWICFFSSFLAFKQTLLTKEKLIITSFIILLAWCSSISVGLNSPYFLSGALFNLTLNINIEQLKQFTKATKIIYPYIITIFSIIFTILVIYFSIEFQKNYNYRDKERSQLTKNLGQLFPEMEGIHTNEITFSYYQELKNILDSLPSSRNNFVVIPNNAFIYPALKSKNPFPLDWLQKAEFQKSEEKLLSMINTTLNKKKIYLIFDKFNSKNLATQLSPIIYDSNEYFYINHIKFKISKITETFYFDVYTNK